jgi:hypothetical protein
VRMCLCLSPGGHWALGMLCACIVIVQAYIVLEGHVPQAPCSSSLTTPPSISRTATFPPSAIRYGRIPSSTMSTLSIVSSRGPESADASAAPEEAPSNGETTSRRTAERSPRLLLHSARSGSDGEIGSDGESTRPSVTRRLGSMIGPRGLMRPHEQRSFLRVCPDLSPPRERRGGGPPQPEAIPQRRKT